MALLRMKTTLHSITTDEFAFNGRNGQNSNEKINGEHSEIVSARVHTLTHIIWVYQELAAYVNHRIKL